MSFVRAVHLRVPAGGTSSYRSSMYHHTILWPAVVVVLFFRWIGTTHHLDSGCVPN